MGLDSRLRKLERRQEVQPPRLWVLMAVSAAECGRPPGAYQGPNGGWVLVTETDDVPDPLPPPLDRYDTTSTKIVAGVNPWRL